MARIWHLLRRPDGIVDRSIFALDTIEDARLAEGEVRVANHWLSVDPYMRGLILEGGGYMPVMPLGSAMVGGAVGEVIESRAAALPVGTPVLHDLGWRDVATLGAEGCTPLPDAKVPIQRYLGHLGMPGQTAYFGLLAAAQAVADDVLFVSAGAGAVGSAVVQIGRIKGMTVIASTSGETKCAALRRWGATAIDRSSPGTIREKLAAAAPAGITAFFDNVGGDHLDAAIESARQGARFALCGMLETYGTGDRLILPQPMRITMKGLRLQGFTIPTYRHRWAEFHEDMLRWTLSGELESAETVHEGLEAVPDAFAGLFTGGNLGKMLVKL